MRRLLADRAQRLRAINHVANGFIGVEAEHDMGVGQPEIRIEQADARSRAGQRQSKINRQAGFAHATFAACYCD